ncbi:cathepsin L-like proteinase [Coccinella septempunctata]|uniref:cathepsin L-like proteinase n=1 Tax=Coccinella septempunctata TaxID=41139 RepID=UPI001D08F661|nr:cathepsin L-like proteinase [Coccinella septempunctata]
MTMNFVTDLKQEYKSFEITSLPTSCADMILFTTVSAIITICVVSGYYHSPPLEIINEQWDLFQKMTNKKYQDWEAADRFKIFKQNYDMIEEHNQRYRKGIETFEMGIGPFADRTPEEFKRMFRARLKPTNFLLGNIGICKLSANRSVAIPVEADHRQYMQAVKDQEAHVCSSGWAFAVTGAVEGVAMRERKWDVSLSEQNLIDCAYGNPYQSYGCDGGSIYGALYYMRLNGITQSSNYPYTALDSRCKSHTGVWKVSIQYGIRDTEHDLLSVVGIRGPVATMIEVTPYIMHYKSGIVSDTSCGKGPNHAVTIVGYGTENGQRYWLLRNSWGTTWGDRGYYKLSRSTNENCFIGQMAYFADIE